MQALYIAKVIMEIRNGVSEHGACFSQNCMCQKGVKTFGEKGRKAAGKELDQLHQRNCFTPIDANELSPEEKAQAMEALMFLQEKKDGTMKGRMVYNGKPTHEWLSREDSASPTAALESMFLTSIIDANEERDVMSADVPNAFIQTPMPDDNKKVIMKITGVLVRLMLEQAPEVYGPHVVCDGERQEGAACCSAQGSAWDAGFIPTLAQQVQEGLGRVQIHFQSA